MMDTSGQARREQKPDATYRDATYLGTSEDDAEEVQDLGFIVDDRRDPRTTLTESWERLDNLDTDEPLETNPCGAFPDPDAQRAWMPEEQFATDFNASRAEGENQEADFVLTSMLEPDPEINTGADDFTDETMETEDAEHLLATGIRGTVPGAAPGLGTSVPQDIGRGGFQIRDNPLTHERDPNLHPEDEEA
jgi:hypothetical protein